MRFDESQHYCVIRMAIEAEDEVGAAIEPGLYIVLYSPPPVGGGKIIKGFGEREGKGRRKKEKKRKFGENITFGSTKS